MKIKLRSFLLEIADDEKADRTLVVHTSRDMHEKLKQKRGEGRCGWWYKSVSGETLWDMFNEHLERYEKDPEQLIDCINLLAMIRFKLELEKE